jgi:hypothetical protein
MKSGSTLRKLCLMTSSNRDDEKAIQELKRMAQLYSNRGLDSNADELLTLVDRMELRIKREAGLVDMSEFRQESNLEDQA